MASFAIEDFIGNGSLQGLLPKLLEEGWDDVPTLKIMNADDMNELNMTQRQKVLFTDKLTLLVILYINIWGSSYSFANLCKQLSDSSVSLDKIKYHKNKVPTKEIRDH